MIASTELFEIFPGVFEWRIDSPEHKVELTSHAVVVEDRIYCFDPVRLADEALERLRRVGIPAAIILTNANHEREARLWREKWQIPIWAAADANLTLETERFDLETGDWEGWRLHRLEGGAQGEIGFRLPERSLMVFGDAVVNLPARRLELLPEKYCRDQALLKRDLVEVAREPFERMILAHGRAVGEGASGRVKALGASA